MKTALATALLLLALPAFGQHESIRRLDLTPSGDASIGYVYDPVITPDAEYVLFRGTATDLTLTPPVQAAPGLPAGAESFLYRCDVRLHQFAQVNLGSQGQALRPVLSSLVPGWRTAMSADGNLVVWTSVDDDPGLGDNNGRLDVYLRDVAAGTTELISGVNGASTAGASSTASISDDGRFVSFLSGSDAIVPGLSGGLQSGTSVSRRAYLHDRLLGTTTLISEFNGGINVDEGVYDAVLAPEGDKLVYTAVKGPLSLGYSSTLPATLYVVDLALNTRQSFGVYMYASFLGVSSHAERISFMTFSSLDPKDLGAGRDAYVLETSTGSHRLVTSKTGGGTVNDNFLTPSISADGRYVQFRTLNGPAFFPGKAMGKTQVLMKDIDTDLTVMNSTSTKGAPGLSVSNLDGVWTGPGRALNSNGDALVFASSYDNLPGNNVGGESSLYLYERWFGSRNLEITNMHVNQTAEISMTGGTPAGAALFGLSTTGQGPFASYWGPIDLSGPVFTMTATFDANGVARLQFPMGPSLGGTTVFAKGLDLVSLRPSTSFFGVVR